MTPGALSGRARVRVDVGGDALGSHRRLLPWDCQGHVGEVRQHGPKRSSGVWRRKCGREGGRGDSAQIKSGSYRGRSDGERTAWRWRTSHGGPAWTQGVRRWRKQSPAGSVSQTLSRCCGRELLARPRTPIVAVSTCLKWVAQPRVELKNAKSF